MDVVIAWFTNNWVNVVAILWSVDQLLKVVSKLTPWGWDDNVSDILGNLLLKFFPKK